MRHLSVSQPIIRTPTSASSSSRWYTTHYSTGDILLNRFFMNVVLVKGARLTKAESSALNRNDKGKLPHSALPICLNPDLVGLSLVEGL